MQIGPSSVRRQGAETIDFWGQEVKRSRSHHATVKSEDLAEVLFSTVRLGRFSGFIMFSLRQAGVINRFYLRRK